MFDLAAPLISAGAHQREEVPRDGGRWPLSVVLRPPPDTPLARTLDTLTQEAAHVAGSGQWQTGQLGAAHLTVRALEPRREVVPSGDPSVRRYLAALERATAHTSWPIGFRVAGLTLTPGTVMACAEPLDDAADAFSDRLAGELLGDAWYERERRDIWYLNLLHFAADIPDPESLITWVKSRRSTTFGTTTVPVPELVRADHRPGHRPHMRLVPLTT
ncbi:hypothetical protein [Kribbella sp. NPDC048915]|uniref:hypothetical protein n=1 Tax=Kribbella sp. NPDC048915 TaxID=3155148 RepID=UPI0033E3F401